MTHWTLAAFTHRGRVRPANEDAIALDSRVLTGDMGSPVGMTTPGDSCLLMVADGMVFRETGFACSSLPSGSSSDQKYGPGYGLRNNQTS